MARTKKPVKEEIKEIVEQAEELEEMVEVKETREYSGLLVSSGNVLLNLACSDKKEGAFVGGTMINIIGDSSSGKTILALTVLAEALKLEDE